MRRSTGISVAIWAVAGMMTALGAGQVMRLPGIASAVQDANVGCSLPGIVNTLHVTPGQRVSAGDLLVSFESATEDLEVDRRQLIWKSKSALEAAQYRLVNIEQDLEATRKLFKTSKSVSRDELAEKELELKLIQAQVRELEVAEAREKIEFEMAREQARRRRVTAPINGIVMELFFEKGEYVQMNSPLLRLVNVDECYFTCNVGPDDATRMSMGQALPIEFDLAGERVTMQGQVIFVSAMIDPASGLQDIRLKFRNVNPRINPGAKGMLVLE